MIRLASPRPGLWALTVDPDGPSPIQTVAETPGEALRDMARILEVLWKDYPAIYSKLVIRLAQDE